jgi:hypothetical protein
MSADGRYVVFQSSADNLVEGVGDATNHDVSNIFLYDTQTGAITAIHPRRRLLGHWRQHPRGNQRRWDDCHLREQRV